MVAVTYKFSVVDLPEIIHNWASSSAFSVLFSEEPETVEASTIKEEVKHCRYLEDSGGESPGHANTSCIIGNSDPS